jgi:hypothetical protein
MLTNAAEQGATKRTEPNELLGKSLLKRSETHLTTPAVIRQSCMTRKRSEVRVLYGPPGQGGFHRAAGAESGATVYRCTSKRKLCSLAFMSSPWGSRTSTAL